MSTPSFTTVPKDPTTKALAVVGFLVFVEFTSGFVQGFYVPLFGEIAAHLGISDAQITWFNTLQTLAAAVFVPVLAKLGDIVGHRRILRIAILAVLAGTLLVALSPVYSLVLVGRVLVGPLAVWLPLEIALVHSRIKGDTARKGIGLLTASLSIGAIVASLVAGLCSSFLPIGGVLLIPCVIVAIAAIIVFVAVPESVERATPRIDYLGFGLLAVFMLGLLVGLSSAQRTGFGSTSTIVPVVVGLVALGCFIAWELRTPVPAIDLRMFASRSLWPVYLSGFLYGMVLFGTQTVLTTFLAADPDAVGYGFGLTPGTISLFTVGSSVLSAIGAATLAYLAKPLGLRQVLMGAIATGIVANLILIFLSGLVLAVAISTVLSGLSFGMLIGGMAAHIAENAPSDQTGIANGVYNSLRTLGGALAGALFGLVLSIFTTHGAVASGHGGYIAVWSICVGCLVLALISLSLLPSRRAASGPKVGASMISTP